MAPAYLVLRTADGEREIALDQGNTWKIGRNADNALVIPDEMISRNHDIVQRTESSEYYLIDMGSLNGSFVNDRRVSVPVVLHDGDHISVGGYEVLFRHPAPEGGPGTDK